MGFDEGYNLWFKSPWGSSSSSPHVAHLRPHLKIYLQSVMIICSFTWSLLNPQSFCFNITSSVYKFCLQRLHIWVSVNLHPLSTCLSLTRRNVHPANTDTNTLSLFDTQKTNPHPVFSCSQIRVHPGAKQLPPQYVLFTSHKNTAALFAQWDCAPLSSSFSCECFNVSYFCSLQKLCQRPYDLQGLGGVNWSTANTGGSDHTGGMTNSPWLPERDKHPFTLTGNLTQFNSRQMPVALRYL